MGVSEQELSRSLAETYSAICGAESMVVQGSANGLFEVVALLDKAVAACSRLKNGPLRLGVREGQQAAAELVRIRTGLGRVAILLSAAAEFHAGWARLVEARGLAYGPDGGEMGLPADSGRGRRLDASG
jgi:hypothetical protein